MLAYLCFSSRITHLIDVILREWCDLVGSLKCRVNVFQGQVRSLGSLQSSSLQRVKASEAHVQVGTSRQPCMQLQTMARASLPGGSPSHFAGRSHRQLVPPRPTVSAPCQMEVLVRIRIGKGQQ